METENDPNVVYGGDESGCMTEGCVSLAQLLVKKLTEGGNMNASINGKTHEAWTSKKVLQQSIIMARTLHAAGLRENEVISILCENRHAYNAITFGALLLNAIVAPINVTYTERELNHALDLSQPKLVFVTTTVAEKTVAVCKNLKFVQNVILIDGEISFDNFVMSLSELVTKYENSPFNIQDFISKPVNIKNQTCLIFCSSGTTGLPKGVEITQENVMSCLQSYGGRMKSLAELHNIPIIVCNISPWFHVYGFLSMLMYTCLSQTLYIFLPRFEEETFYKAIERYKVNFVALVPPIMVLLAKSPKFDQYDLTSLKDISCGAAALSKEVEDKVRERFKGKVLIRQAYGMSETTLGVTGSMENIKPGSVGSLYKGMYAKIVDEEGKSLGPYETGEICFKGDKVMKGYIRDPKATNETVDSDGWLHTGDIAYYDEEKQFFIVDRLKELIKYKAFQVPPAEIEGLLLSNPKIKDCGVIGIPDEESGELPMAFVVKQPGVTLSEKEVQDFVAAHASKLKWLRGGVRFLNEIPKNPSGKILRRELREIFKNLKAKL